MSEIAVIAQCVYCGVDLTIETLTVDHVIPLTRGGSNRDYNRAAACAPCNSAKGPLTASEYLAVRDDPEDLAAMTRLVLAAERPKVSRPDPPKNRQEKLAAKAARERAAGNLGHRPKRRREPLTSTIGEQFRDMIDSITGSEIQLRIQQAEENRRIERERQIKAGTANAAKAAAAARAERMNADVAARNAARDAVALPTGFEPARLEGPV